MNSEELLKTLCNSSGISGFENSLNDIIISAFRSHTDNISVDNLGNIIALKKGCSDGNIKIMLAGHMDEIGLIVKDIDEKGFIKFATVGGIDPRTLLGQEVIIHGQEDIFGVIGAKPPHLQDESERNVAVKIEDMNIDAGFSKNDIEKRISIGDSITIKRNLISLYGNRVAGKALDDRTGVVTMFECAKELSKLKHIPDVYFVSTVQEEVGTRGAITSTYKINPNIGIAIDVGFGRTPEISKEDSLELGKGPGITIGGNIHSGLAEKLVEIAKEYNIPFQYEIEPGPTGTDARAMQITREGIPALCLSLPLRYMHTSVELIDFNDIKNTAKLLALFISSISNENLEGLLCY